MHSSLSPRRQLLYVLRAHAFCTVCMSHSTSKYNIAVHTSLPCEYSRYTCRVLHVGHIYCAFTYVLSHSTSYNTKFVCNSSLPCSECKFPRSRSVLIYVLRARARARASCSVCRTHIMSSYKTNKW